MKNKLVIGAAAFALLALAAAGAYADWWAFNQKYPHASFWAWVISSR